MSGARRTTTVEVTVADAATPEMVEAFGRLIPQLSSSAAPLTLEALAEIVGAPQNTVFLARDPGAGGRIVGTLTLVIFRIPTAVRAWIEDVVVDSGARGRGVGVALTEHALGWSAKAGYSTVHTDWRVANLESSRFWPDRGFRETFYRLARRIEIA